MPAWLAPMAISAGLSLGKKLLGGGGKKPAAAPSDPYADVGRAQELARQGVEGYGETLKPQMLREIGTALGGLNEIGALRSGGAEVALNDIGTNYSQMIGSYAKQASGDAIGYGLQAHRQRFDEEEAAQARKAATLRSIGSVLGAGIGFYAQSKLGGGAKTAIAPGQVTGGYRD